MTLVIDANVVISTLFADLKTREIIFTLKPDAGWLQSCPHSI